jgi:hypothetical protein
MSPKIHPVKMFLEKDDPQPGFRTGGRGQVLEIRGQGSGFRVQKSRI